MSSTTVCSVCKCCTSNNHSYLTHVVCYDCYANQIGHYLFDSSPDQLNDEEKWEIIEFIEDEPHI